LYRTLFLSLCISLILCGSGLFTGSRGTGGRGESNSKRTGVTPLPREHEFYGELESRLQNAADSRGHELIITSAGFDLAKQSQIDNFVVQRVNDVFVEGPVRDGGRWLLYYGGADQNIGGSDARSR
jgi:ABC-type sugar transport system substrate-binding protein